MKVLLMTGSHLIAAAIGFALGIYALPILTAEPSPSPESVQSVAANARYTGEFRRDLADSDALHWGEGSVFISADSIALKGALAPGPDYRLYLSPRFVETEADFAALKSSMIQVGSIRSFENFMVSLPMGVDPSEYSAVIVWCESFGQFITAASYR
jgi:hypothetical protein